MAGEAMQQQSGMVRKSWFGADLQAAAAAAAAENTSLQASNNWYNTLMGAVRQTVVISEILDSRTRNLIAVRASLLPSLTCYAALVWLQTTLGYTHAQV